MAARPLNREESLGLALAVLGHGALVAWLMLQRPAVTLPPPPERMAVTISDETGPVSSAPEPQAAPAPDRGPVLGEAPPPMTEPLRSVPAPASASKAPAKPNPPKAEIKPAPASQKTPPHTTSKRGASVLDPDFGAGIPNAPTAGKAKNTPAAITGAVRSSLAGEVARQLKSRWQGPNGLDVEKLVTTVEWDLNPDGSLSGAPRVISQTGVTDANRAQAGRHKEQALKAIRQAAPFDLSPQYYSAWHHLRFTFDWKINQ